MPKFYTHTPKSQGNMKDVRVGNRKASLPIGLIGESSSFAYGYDGDKYYVTEGVFQYLVTGVNLAFDEAKQLFNALDFNNSIEPSVKSVSSAIKDSRKEKLSGDDLFWFLTDKFN